MSTTIISDVFNPETLVEATRGVFAQKTAFMGSQLARLGVVAVEGSMPQGGPQAIGQTITVPYFGAFGTGFVNNPDGSSITPEKIQQVTETGTITRDSMGFEVSRWAQGNAFVNPAVGDPYEESARQILVAAERAMDSRLITAAGASGVYVKNVYSATVPVFLSWDLLVDAKFDGWGDEQDDIVALLTHSHGQKDLMKLKDSAGRPLWISADASSQAAGGPVDRFCGLPVIVSDRVPITSSVMGAVTSSGTSPPVATLAGTPLGAWNLHIDCTLGGAHETATVRFSTDGGNIWSNSLVTAAAGVPLALIDTAIDSRVGVNGKTGITVAFAAGTFNADNLWTSTASLKVMSMLLKRRALSFWYARRHLALETDKNIRAHTDEAAMHLYAVAHRYRRVAMGTKPGIVQITHNVTNYV